MIRHDIQSYMAARSGMPEIVPAPAFPKTWEDDKDEFLVSPSCSLFMAESSIPNAGLGMFAGKDFGEKELVDPSPQAIIPLIDINENTHLYSGSVLSNYPWSAWTQGADFESRKTDVLFPSLGMLANSHLGLKNVDQDAKDGTKIEIGSLNRSKDFSTGSTTQYFASTFQVTRDTIQTGEEIFVDYGIGYFHHREKLFNMIFPTPDDYAEADEIVRNFSNKLGEEITEANVKEWEQILDDLKKEDENTKESKFRVAFALPDDINDVKLVAKIGTARYSIPESIRSLEWLEENGNCLDNLRRGKSNIPFANYGAFATRYLKAAEVIAPMPVVPLMRGVLEIADDEYSTSQLLLNYCFGHHDSDLLFFPYSSSVHFINHSENPNAFIRWSSSELSQTDNFNKDPKDVYSGLIMEIVAIEDIEIGEEITISYGEDWQSAWNEHVEEWKENSTNPKVIAETLNQQKNVPIKTESEQVNNPYPACVRTACYSREKNETWTTSAAEFENERFCSIQERVMHNGHYYYTAKVFPNGHHRDPVESNEVVKNIPASAVHFVSGNYCSDLHLSSAFRHEIHVPNDMYPKKWIGRNPDHSDFELYDDEDDDDDTYYDEIEDSSKEEL
ncbi:hypothetical protein CTEN210_08704 [Chaetoceros tenuissimus]|uniref:SET domain-containing protein n=1 Tax=Chaetoceros tenuissimus TaxID=426638 RepID=A0AAD3CUK0_9STRA|nr:hypothetical protein CTEN210_08704 [Chaetoceros tenuissimus]